MNFQPSATCPVNLVRIYMQVWYIPANVFIHTVIHNALIFITVIGCTVEINCATATLIKLNLNVDSFVELLQMRSLIAVVKCKMLQ